MRMLERLTLIAAALLLAAGCTGNPSSEYQEYQSNSATPDSTETERPLVKKQLPPKSGTLQKSGGLDTAALGSAFGVGFRKSKTPGRRSPVVAPRPKARTIAVSVNTNRKASTADLKITKPKAPRKVKLLIPENEFQLEGDAFRITYDDIDLLKVLNMEPVTPEAPKLLPDWLKNLNGKRVRIRGFMKPDFQQTGLRGFMMGRDLGVCCFGRNPKVYDLFPVIMKQGTTTDYIARRPFDVVGTFQIKPWIEDGHILRIYRIVDAQVIQ